MMMPELPLDIAQAIERAKLATQERQRTNAADELKLARGERRQEALDVLAQLDKWTRFCEWSALTAKLDEALLVQAEHWTQGSPNLVILAPPDSGKTRTVSAIVRRLLRQGVIRGGSLWKFVSGIVVAHAGELAIARRRHPLGEGEAPEVTRALSATLLVVEDMGWDLDPTTLRDVFDIRCRYDKPLIATSGLTSDQLSRHYGAAVVRRIRQRDGEKSKPIDLHPLKSESVEGCPV